MTQAVLLRAPRQVELAQLPLHRSGEDELLVEVKFSSISSGTERLLWDGSMPTFPGMGYPLVPGYEAVGIVRDAPAHLSNWVDKPVFVPGSQCYGPVKGLFGASASRLLVGAKRALLLPDTIAEVAPGAEPTLLALAATAHHMISVAGAAVFLPEARNWVVGHGVLGRLVARLLKSMGAPNVIVSEINPARLDAASASQFGYEVCSTPAPIAKAFNTIFEVAGDATQLDTLIARLAPGGQVVLGGFYPGAVQFWFAPAFMREAQIRIAAQWQPSDLQAVLQMVVQGQLSLANLLTHTCEPTSAAQAYQLAFSDPRCLKMVLDWSNLQ
jgi:bacteriochlorophyllide a dehydrogenase